MISKNELVLLLKTLNGDSLVGDGNIVISGGPGGSTDWADITGKPAAVTSLSGTNTGDNATNTQYSGLAASKQDALVSGTNIKTINSNSLLGSGNLSLADFSGPSSSVDGEAVVFDGTTGKLGKRPTGTAKFPILGLSDTTFAANEVIYSSGIGNAVASTSALTWNGTTLNATQFNGVALTAAGSSSNYLREDGTYGVPSGGSGISQAQARQLTRR